MIELTTLNGSPIFINPHLIEKMDHRGDTRIIFVSGNSLLIKETNKEVVSKVIAYRKQIGISIQDI